ncbi:MAG: hypothetical protein JNJ95_02280 [Dechloromonas sp.]|nr:hypothetical protein [Dechloromonas sp.]
MLRAIFVVSVTMISLNSAMAATETPIILSGRYEFRTNQESLEILGKQVCFYPSLPSSAAIPRPTEDRRLPWFCFSNAALAASMLGFRLDDNLGKCGIGGHAKIAVANYQRYAGEGDGNDVASLIKVLRISPPKPLYCL